MWKVFALLASLTTVLTQHLEPRRYDYIPKPDETPKPYAFEYIAEAIEGVSTRKETADGSGRVVGSYSIKEDDGRSRIVEYIADELGFRAVVKTNEPGTGNESPANVEMYSSAPKEHEYRHPVRVVEKPPVRVVEPPQPVVTEKPRVVVSRPFYRPRTYRPPVQPYYY